MTINDRFGDQHACGVALRSRPLAVWAIRHAVLAKRLAGSGFWADASPTGVRYPISLRTFGPSTKTQTDETRRTDVFGD